jgi:hypothetical protein
MPEGGARTQDQYNQYIHKSDIAIFLFHTKLGRFTREEFDNAHQAFLQCKHGKVKKPRIYTYFKSDPNETPEISGFRKHIDSLDHFYDTYQSMDDLFVKFDRQMDKMEREGLVIRPEHIDVAKIIKYAVYYFLLPFFMLGGAVSTIYYFQPGNLTVRIKEIRPIPGLPFEQGEISLSYGDKMEKLEIHDEVVFKQIPSKYKHHKSKLMFSSEGFITVDTVIITATFVELAIRRDGTLGRIKGVLIDHESLEPVADAKVKIKDMFTTSNTTGLFQIEIPIEDQAKVQRLEIWNNGYEKFDDTIYITNSEQRIHLTRTHDK